MKKVINHSEECYTSAIDLFTIPFTQTAVEDAKWDKIYPKNALTVNVLEFNISKNAELYTDLSKTELHCKFNVKSLIGGDDKWLPSNNFLHSFFKNIEVKFNNKTIEKTSDMYPYKAYIETLLNFNGESKKTFLSKQGFVKDEYNKFNELDLLPKPIYTKIQKTATDQTEVGFLVQSDNSKVNIGAITRKNLIKNYTLNGKLFLDSFNLNKYMLNNVEITLNLTKGDPDFCLMYPGSLKSSYKIDIEECYINVRRVKLSSDVMYKHAINLEKSMNASYPMPKTEIKKFSLDATSAFQIIPQLSGGDLPNRVIFRLVEQGSINSQNDLNPFNFQFFGLKTFGLKFGSTYLPYTSKLTCTKIDVLSLYNTLFTGVREDSSDIQIDDYLGGNALIAYDLTPDHTPISNHYNLLQNGTLSLELEFDTKPSALVSLIVYFEYNKIVEIDKFREVVSGTA